MAAAPPHQPAGSQSSGLAQASVWALVPVGLVTWRFDRMATVCHPGTGRVTASFAAVAKHYGVSVAICPPRRGNRKGVVEKVNHTAAQRWWRTLADDVTVEQAQAVWTGGARVRGDTRLRATMVLSSTGSSSCCS